jgi:hypothetical protein
MTDITDQTNDEDEHLAGIPFPGPAAPLHVHVILQMWVGDETIDVGSVEFDGRAVFDAEPLSTVANDLSDLDWVFHNATVAGLVDGHDGPFAVEEPEDLAAYLEHRKNLGMTEAYPSAAEALEAGRIEHLKEKLATALAEVERLRGELGGVEVDTCAAPAST